MSICSIYSFGNPWTAAEICWRNFSSFVAHHAKCFGTDMLIQARMQKESADR